MVDKFVLTSEQCELLVALENAGSIRELSERLGRDESAISRQIKAVADLAPVLEKKERRWGLSPMGKRLAQWARDASENQRRILQERTVLRIATTREFSSKVLIPNIKALINGDEATFSIRTSDDGIEEDLLSGRADVGIDCGRPEDPLIRFKAVLSEPYLVVASPEFLKRHPLRQKEDLISIPHLRFIRDPAMRLLEMNVDLTNIAGSFNDLSSVRAACVSGLGWATLPRYTVEQEIASGSLRGIKDWVSQPRSFGVWWVRERLSSKYWVERTIAWLEKQKI